MDNIESSIHSLLAELKGKCPVFRPALFPNYLFNPHATLNSFLLESIKTSSNKSNHTQYNECAVMTDIDYPSRQVKVIQAKVVDSIEKKLSSVGAMMKTLVIGDDSEIDVLCDRFCILNQISTSRTKKEYLMEIYNIAYAIQVLLSNIPGLTISIQGLQYPAKETKIVSIAHSLFEQPKLVKLNASAAAATATKSNDLSNDSQSESSDSDDDMVANDSKHKNRKRRRGKDSMK